MKYSIIKETDIHRQSYFETLCFTDFFPSSELQNKYKIEGQVMVKSTYLLILFRACTFLLLSFLESD